MSLVLQALGLAWKQASLGLILGVAFSLLALLAGTHGAAYLAGKSGADKSAEIATLNAKIANYERDLEVTRRAEKRAVDLTAELKAEVLHVQKQVSDYEADIARQQAEYERQLAEAKAAVPKLDDPPPDVGTPAPPVVAPPPRPVRPVPRVVPTPRNWSLDPRDADRLRRIQ